MSLGVQNRGGGGIVNKIQEIGIKIGQKAGKVTWLNKVATAITKTKIYTSLNKNPQRELKVAEIDQNIFEKAQDKVSQQAASRANKASRNKSSFKQPSEKIDRRNLSKYPFLKGLLPQKLEIVNKIADALSINVSSDDANDLQKLKGIAEFVNSADVNLTFDIDKGLEPEQLVLLQKLFPNIDQNILKGLNFIRANKQLGIALEDTIRYINSNGINKINGDIEEAKKELQEAWNSTELPSGLMETISEEHYPEYFVRSDLMRKIESAVKNLKGEEKETFDILAKEMGLGEKASIAYRNREFLIEKATVENLEKVSDIIELMQLLKSKGFSAPYSDFLKGILEKHPKDAEQTLEQYADKIISTFKKQSVSRISDAISKIKSFKGSKELFDQLVQENTHIQNASMQCSNRDFLTKLSNENLEKILKVIKTMDF